MDLADLLTASQVRARVPAADADEAIAAAGELLVATGAASERYVEAMQVALRELGPYMVVAPGVALPHARPEDGAHGPGVALVTLADPVTFGHEHNDPVDVVVAFSATGKDAHLRVLQQLATLLGDEDGLDRLRASKDQEALLATAHELLEETVPGSADEQPGRTD